MRVDAHHHLWDRAVHEQPWTDGIEALQGSFTVAQLEPQLRAAELDATVAIHCLADEDESRWLLADGADGGSVRGVVGWVDITADDVAQRIAGLRAGPGGERLVGLRSLVQAQTDPQWLQRSDVRRGLAAIGRAGLTFDLLISAAQLPAAVDVVRALPEVRFVLDHGGNPNPLAAAEWRVHIAELAACPNLVCKVSGLVTRLPRGARPSAGALRPWAEHLLERFGPDRLLFGSDWPVCLMVSSYAEVAATAHDLFAELTPGEQADVFGGVAVRTYGLAAA